MKETEKILLKEQKTDYLLKSKKINSAQKLFSKYEDNLSKTAIHYIEEDDENVDEMITEFKQSFSLHPELLVTAIQEYLPQLLNYTARFSPSNINKVEKAVKEKLQKIQTLSSSGNTEEAELSARELYAVLDEADATKLPEAQAVITLSKNIVKDLSAFLIKSGQKQNLDSYYNMLQIKDEDLDGIKKEAREKIVGEYIKTDAIVQTIIQKYNGRNTELKSKKYGEPLYDLHHEEFADSLKTEFADEIYQNAKLYQENMTREEFDQTFNIFLEKFSKGHHLLTKGDTLWGDPDALLKTGSPYYPAHMYAKAAAETLSETLSAKKTMNGENLETAGKQWFDFQTENVFGVEQINKYNQKLASAIDPKKEMRNVKKDMAAFKRMNNAIVSIRNIMEDRENFSNGIKHVKEYNKILGDDKVDEKEIDKLELAFADAKMHKLKRIKIINPESIRREIEDLTRNETQGNLTLNGAKTLFIGKRENDVKTQEQLKRGAFANSYFNLRVCLASSVQPKNHVETKAANVSQCIQKYKDELGREGDRYMSASSGPLTPLVGVTGVGALLAFLAILKDVQKIAVIKNLKKIEDQRIKVINIEQGVDSLSQAKAIDIYMNFKSSNKDFDKATINTFEKPEVFAYIFDTYVKDHSTNFDATGIRKITSDEEYLKTKEALSAELLLDLKDLIEQKEDYLPSSLKREADALKTMGKKLKTLLAELEVIKSKRPISRFELESKLGEIKVLQKTIQEASNDVSVLYSKYSTQNNKNQNGIYEGLEKTISLQQESIQANKKIYTALKENQSNAKSPSEKEEYKNAIADLILKQKALMSSLDKNKEKIKNIQPIDKTETKINFNNQEWQLHKEAVKKTNNNNSGLILNLKKLQALTYGKPEMQLMIIKKQEKILREKLSDAITQIKSGRLSKEEKTKQQLRINLLQKIYSKNNTLGKEFLAYQSENAEVYKNADPSILFDSFTNKEIENILKQAIESNPFNGTQNISSKEDVAIKIFQDDEQTGISYEIKNSQEEKSLLKTIEEVFKPQKSIFNKEQQNNRNKAKL